MTLFYLAPQDHREYLSASCTVEPVMLRSSEKTHSSWAFLRMIWAESHSYVGAGAFTIACTVCFDGWSPFSEILCLGMKGAAVIPKESLLYWNSPLRIDSYCTSLYAFTTSNLETFPTSQRCPQVINFWLIIAFSFWCLIHCHLIVIINPHCFILFQCCNKLHSPFWKVDFLVTSQVPFPSFLQHREMILVYKNRFGLQDPCTTLHVWIVG